MKINEWEIWYSYSTYFIVGEINLEKVAYNMASTGFAECVFLRDGLTYWRKKDGFQKGYTTINLRKDKKLSIIEAHTFNKEKIEATKYSLETWGIASQFRFCELRIFSEYNFLPPPYLKAYLGLSRLISKDFGIVEFYPVITLYDTGVLLVEFRIMSPKKPTDLERFIYDYENLYQIEFEEIECPPSISQLAPTAYHYYQFYPDSLLKRIKFSFNQILHNVAIEDLTFEKKDSDFSYKLAPLPSSLDEDESTLSFAQTLFSIVGYLITKPETGLKFLTKGQLFPPEIGNYWIGRPHIHIIKHENQKDISSKNIETNKEFLVKILNRTSGELNKINDIPLPPDTRLFNDYSSFITKAVTLWVWSKKGIDAQEKWKDPNSGHLIYENQVKTELLDYGYMIYKCLLERLNNVKDTLEIIQERKNIYDLQNRMQNVSQFGEIYDQLNTGWEAYGLPKLQLMIDKKILILEAESKIRETRKSQKIAESLSVLFGLIAIPTFALEVLKPIWEILDIWHPNNINLAKLFYISVTFILVLFFIHFIYKKKED